MGPPTKFNPAMRTLKFKGDNYITNQYRRHEVQFDRDFSALEHVVKREGYLCALEAHNMVVVKACVGVDMSEPRKLQPDLKVLLRKRDSVIRQLNQSTLDVVNAVKTWRQAMVHAEEFYWGHSNYLLKISTDCWFLNNDNYLKKKLGVDTFLMERIPFLGIYQNTSWDGKDALFTPNELAEMKEAIEYILEEETRFGWVIRQHDGRQKTRTVHEPTAHSGSHAVGQGNNMTQMVRTGHPFSGQQTATRAVEADLSRGYNIRRPWEDGAVTGQTGMHPRNLRQARAALTKGRPSTNHGGSRKSLSSKKSLTARPGTSSATSSSYRPNDSGWSQFSKNSSQYSRQSRQQQQQQQQQQSYRPEWDDDTLDKRSKWEEFTHTLGRSSIPTAAASYAK
jgi:hypothetical protein